MQDSVNIAIVKICYVYNTNVCVVDIRPLAIYNLPWATQKNPGLSMELSGTFYLEVGRRIRVAREKAGLTQETLASKVGLTRTSVTNIEKGRQKLLLHTFWSLAAALSIPPIDLLPDLPDALPGMELDELLKHHPEGERAWIKSAIDSGRKAK